ncbi:helix-turn-helix transcriptional regulator [Leifsonia sp. NPDC077715]|uniref:helix-turn-helix transcriptional regulator n=1 Tax=Leifsonia sp. NPDC077715 TaxID=3155539 RepID=UPI0034253D51
MDAEDRTWMRDLGALLALPSLWVDHTPTEIADGLLSVLVGMLRLDAAFARFAGPDGEALEAWRPSGPAARLRLLAAIDGHAPQSPGRRPGVTAGALRSHDDDADGIAKVATLDLTLPWGTGVVAVSAPRSDFPTERETHLLRVAVGQAAIALHTARRIAREQAARRDAEQEVERRDRMLRSLIDDLSPAVSAVSRRLQQASREAEGPAPTSVLTPPAPTAAAADAPLTASLTRRELEVLGLLAQGLSNKEMAALLWLSDRTIERHITSLYRKIGVARRSEATAYAVRHGIA